MCDAWVWPCRSWLAGFGVAMTCPLSLAGLITVHEGGPTVPLAQFLSSTGARSGAGQPIAAAIGTTLPISFPITTTSMRPGVLRQPLQLRTAGRLAAPMFLVGDDPLSRQWLASNRDRLKQQGATGMAVNVATLEAFRALRALAPEIPMAFGSMDSLARHSGLTTYPLFVSVDGRAFQELP